MFARSQLQRWEGGGGQAFFQGNHVFSADGKVVGGERRLALVERLARAIY